MHNEAQAQLVVENWHSSEEMVALLSALESEEEPKVSVLESMALVETENTSILHKEVEDLVKEEFEQVSITQATQTSSNDDAEDQAREMDSDAHQGIRFCLISSKLYFILYFQCIYTGLIFFHYMQHQKKQFKCKAMNWMWKFR